MSIDLLIEGADKRDLKSFFADKLTVDLSEDIVMIKIGAYDLELVGKISDDHKLKLQPTPAGRIQIIPYDTKNRIDRPITIIASDRRVYHDRAVLRSENKNSRRLQNFLQYLGRQYNIGNTFTETYANILQDFET